MQYVADSNSAHAHHARSRRATGRHRSDIDFSLGCKARAPERSIEFIGCRKEKYAVAARVLVLMRGHVS
jgi:hypothetical protein